IPFVDKAWKITVISVVISTVTSVLLAIAVNTNPVISGGIGFFVAAIIAYPVGKIILKYLEIIQRQNKQLMHLNAELDAYDHTVAHNLKNSINSILLNSQMLIQITEETDKSQTYARRIESVSREMTKTIDSLLLLSSVREEDVPLEAVDMADVIFRAQKRIESYIYRYNPDIKYPETWEVGIGYEPWLIEVWANYLSNAVKYSGEQSIIKCGSDVLTSGQVRYWVQDNGRGLNIDEQQQLFQRFSRTERIDGHGLGLSIVMQIMTRLGGTAGVESEGHGQGSTFYFTLPARIS
ncbi:MAG: sensor histidine kinase, partial [Aggregatilineales bacterium]